MVTKAIAGLSDRKVQFTYADMLARTVSQLEAKPGVFELARTGIDAAIEREQLIPLDREKGLFTSNIHVLDELFVKALSRGSAPESCLRHARCLCCASCTFQRCGQRAGAGPAGDGDCLRTGRGHGAAGAGG